MVERDVGVAFDVALGGARPVEGIALLVSGCRGKAGHPRNELFDWAWRDWMAQWALAERHILIGGGPVT